MAVALSRWEELEEFLYEFNLSGETFASGEYALTRGLSAEEASRDIQAYLTAQRGKRAQTLYVLKRIAGTRTRNARWSVGVRTSDVRELGQCLAEDVKTRVLRALAPDLRRIAVLNPRAAKRAEQQIHSILDGALVVLANAVNGDTPS